MWEERPPSRSDTHQCGSERMRRGYRARLAKEGCCLAFFSFYPARQRARFWLAAPSRGLLQHHHTCKMNWTQALDFVSSVAYCQVSYMAATTANVPDMTK